MAYVHSDPPPDYKETSNGVNGVYVVPDDTLDTKQPPSENEEEVDPWALPELKVDFKPWAELSTGGKLQRLFLHYIGKTVLMLGFLYLFICSLGFLGDAFKLLGGKAAGEAFSNSHLLSNPVAGLMIGVLATVLLQSSSTTTSIIVAMVAEEVLTVDLAIPIVMGANIGTSVTNTIVSIGQITDRDSFRRAFAGATVHDMFNWLTVLLLLPIEVASGYLHKLSEAIINEFFQDTKESAKQDYLKVITKPFTSLVIQLDSGVIKKIALKDESVVGKSVIKHCCEKGWKSVNGSECPNYCRFMFESLSRDEGWSDAAVGAVLLVLALVILCICLFAIVKLLHSLLKGQVAHIIRKFVNANFPGVCGYFTGYLAILIGAGLTFLVQSSSIFTSSLTPLVGMGVITIERMYPLTLGSNIGTTTTGILAALAQDADKIPKALQIAFCHLFFNISGILIFYPIPKFRPPINMAKFLGEETAKYRWFAVIYLFLMFFILPAAGFGLSLVSWIAMAAVFIPTLLLIIIVVIVKFIQRRFPHALPRKLRNWKWLPEFLRSLAPYDRLLMKMTGNCYCCRKCGCCKSIYEKEDEDKDIEMNKSGIEIEVQNGQIMESPVNTRL